MEEGGTWEGKRSGILGKRNKKRRRNGKSINLLVRLLTEILTKSCKKRLPMSVTYDIVHMYIILIVNLHSE